MSRIPYGGAQSQSSATTLYLTAKYAIGKNLIAGGSSTGTYRNSRWDKEDEDEKRIDYGGQPSYGRKPSDVRRSRSKSPYRSNISFREDRPSIVGKCYIWGSISCRMSICTKPKYIAKIGSNSAIMQVYINKLRNKGQNGINISENEDPVSECSEVM